MDSMREIGRTLTTEQNLTGEDITWLIAMAQAVLRAFAWMEGQPMRSLAASLNISPQTSTPHCVWWSRRCCGFGGVRRRWNKPRPLPTPRYSD